AVGPQGLVGEFVDGLPARAWDYGYPGVSRARMSSVSAYAADELRLGALFLEAGLRVETWDGSAEGAPQGIAWRGVFPRAQARWSPLEEGRLAFVLGYARYGHPLRLKDLAFSDPSGPQGKVYLWTDTNGNGVVDPGEVGPLIAVVGPGSLDGTSVRLAPSLQQPTTDELLASVEARFGKTRLAFAGIRRRARNLLETVNVGVPLSDYTVTLVPDPASDLVGGTTEQLLPIYGRSPASFGKDRYLLTNPAGHDTLYEGLEINLDTTLLSRLSLHLGATASRAEGSSGNRGFGVLENDAGVIGELFDDPNADTFSRGRLFFDRAYTLKISALYRAPGGVLLGLLARYQDGQPFSRLVIAPDLPQGPEAIMAFPRGLSRFHDVLTVDIRIEKGLRLGGRRVSLVLAAFNALGTAGEIEEDVVTLPTFRRITAVQPPRVVTLGLAVAF
ncbi:MAG TPA: hypothetical protein VN083_08955, partial [Vicinamibacteria bacterium]|nr:hypothetical protein [Vicinamibacteria bacterium]